MSRTRKPLVGGRWSRHFGRAPSHHYRSRKWLTWCKEIFGRAARHRVKQELRSRTPEELQELELPTRKEQIFDRWFYD